jgi:hypothetical protein
MALTRRSIATLLDLVEIKLSCIEVVDREDHREVKALRACREELRQMLERQPARALAGRPGLVPMPEGPQPSMG